MLSDTQKLEAELPALANRVVMVTGLDRRVDYEIMGAIAIMGGRYEWDPDDQNYRGTTSVDAAITLIPDGWGIILDSDGCHCRVIEHDMSLHDAKYASCDHRRVITHLVSLMVGKSCCHQQRLIDS